MTDYEKDNEASWNPASDLFGILHHHIYGIYPEPGYEAYSNDRTVPSETLRPDRTRQAPVRIPFQQDKTGMTAGLCLVNALKTVSNGHA